MKKESLNHRKKINMEHGGKSKSKQPAKKSSKKVEKEKSHSENKKKPVTSQLPHAKETKKSDVVKNNSASSSTDRVDGVSVIPKKKNEKMHSKNFNSNLNLKSISDDGDERQRASNDDNNNQDKFVALGGSAELTESNSIDDPNTSSASTSSGPENDTSSSNTNIQLENGGIDSSCYVGNDNDNGVGVACFKTNAVEGFPPSTQDEISNESDKKTVLGELPEKSSKKQNSKSENDAMLSKLSQKVEEKNKNSKSSKSKLDDKEKAEPEKCMKDFGKFSASPSKNKRSCESIASKNSETSSDSGSCTGNTSEETKHIQDVKKEIDINIFVSEPVADKDKLEKSPSVNLKKTNPSISGANSGGKTSPVQGAKNQRQTNNTKNIKKQAPELKVLQKITSENNGSVNVTLLIPLLAKAELSHSEIQNLIDLLLNKQQDSTIDAEWIGSGRQDPMVKLKKQVAEKDKALAAEQEAHQAVQNKVKELRAELNNEKHVNRQREEAFNNLKAELQTLNARLQAATEEKLNFGKQIQQLQSKLNEECAISRSLKDENSKTKNSLQQELLSQRQQLEMHIAHLSDQHQTTVMTLEAQLREVVPRLQEQESANAQLTDENVILRERVSVLETQITHYQQTHPTTQDLMIQLEETRNVRTMLERDLNNQQFEVSRLTNELRSMTEQLNRKNAEVEKFNCIVNNMKIENEELLKENSRNNEQINLSLNEKAQLQKEYKELKDQFMAMCEKSNSSEQLQEMENTACRYRDKLNEKTQELYQLQERLAQLESSNNDTQLHDTELEEKRKIIDELNDKLNKQQEKNEDLRRKNWKAMEALSNMEKTLESKVKGMPCSSHEIKLQERKAFAEHIKKSLPNICESNLKLPSSYEDDVWFPYLENVFCEFSQNLAAESDSQFIPSLDESIVPTDNVLVLDELEKQNKQLQMMVSRYKRIISETEKMLNSLQNHIEQEEHRWSSQVNLLSEQVETMSNKVQVLQTQLNSLSEERNHLLDKVKNTQNGCAENGIEEQKPTSRVDKCFPLMANSSINNISS